MKKILYILTSFMFLFSAQSSFASSMEKITFSKAKKELIKIYNNDDKHRVTIYAGCKYDKSGHIDKKSCGYIPKNKKNKRSKKIEWEHVMPASWMGNTLSCWNKDLQKKPMFHKKISGRKNCRKNSEYFNTMEGDMHNLFPAIGELNQYRSNYKFGHILGEARVFGEVDFEVDSNRKTVEIEYNAKGRVSRAMLYMHWKYNIPLSHDDVTMYRAWNEEYKPSKWERYRERVIYDIQGNRNPFIYNHDYNFIIIQ